nr:helix-turn-helix transcriptional regulator [uncultured Sediminibacterium sp.]
MKKPISDYHLKVGLSIREYRQEYQLTVSELAQSCGIKVEILERIERGEVNFRLTTLLKFIRVMGSLAFPAKEKS